MWIPTVRVRAGQHDRLVVGDAAASAASRPKLGRRFAPQARAINSYAATYKHVPLKLYEPNHPESRLAPGLLPGPTPRTPSGTEQQGRAAACRTQRACNYRARAPSQSFPSAARMSPRPAAAAGHVCVGLVLVLAFTPFPERNQLLCRAAHSRPGSLVFLLQTVCRFWGHGLKKGDRIIAV
jgi:hypothetical protein